MEAPVRTKRKVPFLIDNIDYFSHYVLVMGVARPVL